MCGIVGFTNKNWAAPPERIREATETLIHRGPDQQGVFQSSLFSMGATRLKIIDLASGNQPIITEDGQTGIVFNGEIYNHMEVRSELEDLGHRFTSHSDTETVLRAFVQWDKECFQRLRGMFAVALWKKEQRRIVLARDRMGIKPLYICRKGEDIFFGSELKSILIHPEIERRISLNGLDCYLSLNYVPCPWTLIEGIEKLPPGCWLEWRDGKMSSDAYWRLPFGEVREYTLDAAKEELDSLLQQSVREHLLSDVPLGIWLSGGMDSTTILHYASQASNSRLKTFSISFRGRSFDETKYIHRAVKQYGTDHEELDLTPEVNLQSAIEEFAYYSDEPSADGFEYKLKRFLEGSLLPPGHAHVFWNGTFNDDEKHSLLKVLLPGSFHRLLAEMNHLPRTTDPLAPFLWFDQKYYLADDILVKSDRMSMAHAVEVRPPFLDHRIVEFAAKLPARLKIRGAEQKLVLSELRKDKLPASIIQGKKTGFDIPAHEWLRGPLRAMLVDTLQEGLSEYRDLFHGEVVEGFLKGHFDRQANAGYHLWGLMILFQWMKKWRIQAASSTAPKVLLQARAGAST